MSIPCRKRTYDCNIMHSCYAYDAFLLIELKCIWSIHQQKCLWRLIFTNFMHYKWFASSFLPSTDLQQTKCWHYIFLNVWYNQLTSYSMQSLANSNCRSPGFLSKALLYTLGIPLMVKIDLLLYKVSLLPWRMFYINHLSCYQTDLMSVSPSTHLHQDQRVLLNEWMNEFIPGK